MKDSEKSNGSANPHSSYHYSTKTDEQLLTRNPESKQLVDIHPIPDTPFCATKFGDHWCLTMGRYKLTGPLKTKNQVIKFSKDVTWDILTKVIMIIATDVAETTKKEQTL